MNIIAITLAYTIPLIYENVSNYFKETIRDRI